MACATVVGRERRLRWRKIARQPHRDFAFDADPDEIAGLQRHAAGVNALGKHAAAAGMRDIEILLHHRAGAADLVADQRAEIGRQQIAQRLLNPVALGLVPRRESGGQRLKRRAVAAGGGDGFGGREGVGHRRRPSKNLSKP